MTENGTLSIKPDIARALWNQALEEAAAVSAITDDLERNRRTTKAYAEMYLRQPELIWVGAAAFVSKDIGGELSKLASMSVWGALNLGNRIVFDDLYRYFRYYELIKTQGGSQNLEGYTKFLPADTHPDVIEAMEMLIHPEQSYEANMRLLNYEQAVTVQEKLYNSVWFRRNLDLTRLTNYSLGIIDVSFDRRLPENAPADISVVFAQHQGDLYNHDDRIQFSYALMDKFCSLISTDQGRRHIETELQALACFKGETPGWRTAWQGFLGDIFKEQAGPKPEKPAEWGQHKNLT